MFEYLKSMCEQVGVEVQRMDAGFTSTLAKQLEYAKTRNYDAVFPSFHAREYIPVSNEVDPGAETVTYRMYTPFGAAQFVANYADDLPLVDSLGEEETARVHSFGVAYQWSVQDIRRAGMSGQPLNARKAGAARKAWEQLVEDTAATGNTARGLSGIANNANVTLVTPDTGTWSTATGFQIYDDMAKLIKSVIVRTKGVFEVTQVLLDLDNYALIQKKRYSTTGDNPITVLQALKTNFPEVTFSKWYRLGTADAAGTGPRLIAYAKSPEVLTLEIPQEYTELPAQAKNLSFVVNTHGRIAGVLMYYPVAVSYMDGC